MYHYSNLSSFLIYQTFIYFNVSYNFTTNYDLRKYKTYFNILLFCIFNVEACSCIS